MPLGHELQLMLVLLASCGSQSAVKSPWLQLAAVALPLRWAPSAVEWNSHCPPHVQAVAIPFAV